MKTLFVFSCKPLDLVSNSRYFQVSMDVTIAYISRRINYAAKHFILKTLDYLDVWFLCATPKLHTINPQRFQNLSAQT